MLPERTGPAVLLVGHGSRDPEANREFEALVAAFRVRHPGRAVAHGYIELAPPAADVALEDLLTRARDVTVVPVALFRAGHVKNDLPIVLERARRAHPEARLRVADALGVHPALLRAALDRAADRTEPGASAPALVVVGRGSSDPDANGDFCKLVRLLQEGTGARWVFPCFVGISRPFLSETLETAARVRPDRLLVLPYFLFGGVLVDRIRNEVEAFGARSPWIRTAVAPHLGDHEGILEGIDARIAEAEGTAGPLPCETCQYRVPLPGREDQVGGLKAMLWSLRHLYTHNQAVPHVHAHKPIRKHVFVCTNIDCADRGSLPLLAALRRRIREAGLADAIRVTRTSCMGRCGEGPTVAVYPDGVWYRGVRAEDAGELFEEHLRGDRLVGRLVDNILQ